MLDPRQTFIDVTVQLGRDVTIYPGTLLQGDTVIGGGSDIGPHVQLDGCVVGRDCVVRQTAGLDAEIGDGAVVGPYVHLPAGANIVSGAVTGPFYTATVGD